MLSRGHPPSQLTKGWNKHLLRYPKDRNTNYSSLRRWFRLMLFWVASNKDKKDVQDLIANRPSATINRTVPSKTASTIPMSTVPPILNAPYDSKEANIDNSWSKTYNRHILLGNGDCFFSAVNCFMRFLEI